MLRSAREDAARLGDPLLGTLTWIQEGTLWGRVGDWDRCVEALEHAREGEALLDPPQTWALRLNLGQAELGVGNTAAAAAWAEAAAEVAAAHGLVDLEFKARHNRAVVAFVDGDLPQALRLMRAADAMDTPVSRDRHRLDEADVLIDAGLVDAARSTLRQALDSARHDGHRIEEGDIALRLARCGVLTGDLEGAAEHVRVALAAFGALQADELVLEAELVQARIDVAAGTGLPSVVTTLARRNARRAPASPSDRAAVRLEAEARVLLGDADGAERRLTGLHAARVGGASLAAGLAEALVRARIADLRGRPDEVERQAVAGSRLLATHQIASSSLDVRAAMALHGRGLAAFDVARVLQDGTPDDVLRTVERWRAVSQRVDPVTTAPDAELADLTRELRRLRRLLTEVDDDAAGTVPAAVADLEPRVAHREWTLVTAAGSAREDSSVGAEEVRSAAGERGSGVVALVESGADLVAVTVGSGPTRVRRVADVAETAALVTRLRRDLRARATISADSPMAATLVRATTSSLERVDALFRDLWSGDRRVVLVPTGVVSGLPWGLLPSLRGRPVTVAPSLTRWVRGAPARSTATAGLAPVRALFGPGLAHSGPEIRAVRGAWGDPAGADTDPAPMSSADVVDALGSARVVHLAAHGTHEAQSPLFSSVRMADGPVFAHEFPRPVAAEHVALSACDVGRFSTRPGDEPLGLAIALVSLGATSVLAAVAPVADELAAAAMVEHHRRIASGTDAAEAWAGVVEKHPDAGVFCLYGSEWSTTTRREGAGSVR